MPTTAVLVYQGHNNLRYKITTEGGRTAPGGTVTIPSTGGATPDLQTDALAGPIHEIARAGVDGIGTVAPLALTQAECRDILVADDTGASVGSRQAPRARLQLAPRSAAGFSVDVNVDGSANPEIIITGTEDGVTYLDVDFIDGIGA
jgi:hypothetical protein